MGGDTMGQGMMGGGMMGPGMMAVGACKVVDGKISPWAGAFSMLREELDLMSRPHPRAIRQKPIAVPG